MATKAWAPLLAAAIASGQVLPSLHLGQGYNLVLGDPHGFQVGEIDPGWQASILAPSSLQHEWVQPVNHCTYESTTSHVSGGKTAQDSLQREVSAKAALGVPELWSAAFTGSGSVQIMNASAWKSGTQYFESRARCELYRSAVPPVGFTNLTFTDDFAEAVREIPVDSPGVDVQEWLFDNIIANYGTHMSTAVVTGGLYMHRSWMTSSSYDILVQAATAGGFTVEAAARSFFRSFATPSGSGGYAWDKAQKEAFQQATRSGGDKTFTQGGAFVPDDAQAWAAALGSQPAAIGSPGNELVPLSDLLTARHFPGDPAIGRKQQALLSALQGYCARMGAKGCTPRPVDWRTDFIPTFAEVTSLAWAPGGDRLASAGGGTIRVWDAATGNLLQTLDGGERGVSSVAYSPDGERLVAASFYHIQVWDAVNGSLLQSLQGHRNYTFSVSYSPDGRSFASGSFDGTVLVWDAATGRLLHNMTAGGRARVRSVAYSPNSACIASGGDGPILFWDASTGAQGQGGGSPDAGLVTGLAYSPDGKSLAAAGITTRIVDAQSGHVLHTMDAPNISTSVAYSPDGQRLAFGTTDGAVLVWDVPPGEAPMTLQAHTDNVWVVSYSPNGRYLASGSSDQTIRIWDAASSSLLHTMQATRDVPTKGKPRNVVRERPVRKGASVAAGMGIKQSSKSFGARTAVSAAVPAEEVVV